MSVKLLTEHHLQFLSLKGDFTGSSESRLVKIQHCWKSHVAAQMYQGVFLSTGSLDFEHYATSAKFEIERKKKLLAVFLTKRGVP